MKGHPNGVAFYFAGLAACFSDLVFPRHSGTKKFPTVGSGTATQLCYAACVNIAQSDSFEPFRDKLVAEGFAFSPATVMRACLEQSGDLQDWYAFTESWNDLALDNYLIDHGRYRRRRHAVFTASGTIADRARKIERAEHQPHYQSRLYNKLQGGIERWFEPIEPRIGDGSSLRTILHFCHGLSGAMAPDVHSWRVEVHQFRIEARLDESGQPTPEGVHRDGVDYVLVLMIKRTNIAQGTTTIHARDDRVLGSFTLAEPFDAALVDDARVHHGVTAVEAIDSMQPAHRDVLVVTFKRSD
jgi:hypothetical protein